MKNYPQVGTDVIIKQTGEKLKVIALWKPGRVVLSDNSIMHLRGLKQAMREDIYKGMNFGFKVDSGLHDQDSYTIVSVGPKDIKYRDNRLNHNHIMRVSAFMNLLNRGGILT